VLNLDEGLRIGRVKIAEAANLYGERVHGRRTVFGSIASWLARSPPYEVHLTSVSALARRYASLFQTLVKQFVEAQNEQNIRRIAFDKC
jgi:hypothetical protein